MSIRAPFTLLFGGWYQRTTLHLSEIYDFLALGRSHSELDPEKLRSLHDHLHLTQVSRQAGYLEYVLAQTSDGITIRYYEDGLYVLELTTADIPPAKDRLEHYFKNEFEPAVSYIFSLGAPIPKVLANISSVHPLVVATTTDKPEQLDIDTTQYGAVYSRITEKGVTVYKTPHYIFIASAPKSSAAVTELMEMQIFFREFKDQLGKYLQIHRKIWEEIGDIKERHVVSGHQIAPLRARLDSYQKTLNLINNRINQMGTYVHTRASLAKDLQIEQHLKSLFEYKFEVLSNTLAYIKEIWAMTREYLASGIAVLRELETQATTNSIKSLQIVTSIGVVTSLLTFTTRVDSLKLTALGFTALVLLVVVTWLLNLAVAVYFRRLKYQLKFTDQATDI